MISSRSNSRRSRFLSSLPASQLALLALATTALLSASVYAIYRSSHKPSAEDEDDKGVDIPSRGPSPTRAQQRQLDETNRQRRRNERTASGSQSSTAVQKPKSGIPRNAKGLILTVSVKN
ncbi:hypothetical protein HDV05_000728, partial [Chytridiales sp. JEL 0842]